MIEALIGLLMFLVTQVSKKWKVPSTYLMAGMLVVVSGVYTALQFNNPELLTKLTEFVTTAFATSQGLRLVYNKLNKSFSIDEKIGINVTK